MSMIKKLLLYAGLEKDEFDMLIPTAKTENGRSLGIYTIITTAFFFICFLISVFIGGAMAVNRTAFLIMMIVNGALLICSKTVLKKYPDWVSAFCIAFVLAQYAYSMIVSLKREDVPGTTAFAVLLIMPCLFNYRPVYMIAVTILVQIVYCVISVSTKVASVAMLDIWNGVLFGIIAVLLCFYQMRVKFRSLLQNQKNRELSEIDLLTGTKNRNCFEQRRNDYAGICESSLACIYTDVNGLHDLNDQQGHDAGDLMLSTVAAELKKRFNTDEVYRIGGDEFVTFCPDREQEEIERLIREMIATVEAAGYSVSVGFACREKSQLELNPLIREAEKAMYKEKRHYYEQKGYVRRHLGAEE